MKISRSFNKMIKLSEKISKAKEEAKGMIVDIGVEREELDTLETQIKSVIKL